MTAYGYARVSTEDQNLALQFDALKRHGVPRKHVFTDKLSGGRDDRPGLQEVLTLLQAGDILYVWKIDRLWRSVKHLMITFDRVKEVGATVRSLTEAFDLDAPSGKLLATVLGGVAEYERAVNSERTKAGLAAAKKRGVKLGAKPVLVGEKYDLVRDMMLRGIPGHQIARAVKCSEATLYTTFPGGRKALRAAEKLAKNATD